jgi:hypothetical protein
MRQYEPIWNQIKQNGLCEISAHKAYHRRIRKAIRKEKDQDLAYKMHWLEQSPPMEATVTTKCTGSVIRFTLHIRPLITLDTI